jgi:hypothetical protein
MYSVSTGSAFRGATDFDEINGKVDTIRGEDFWIVYPEHLDMKAFDV